MRRLACWFPANEARFHWRVQLFATSQLAWHHPVRHFRSLHPVLVSRSQEWEEEEEESHWRTARTWLELWSVSVWCCCGSFPSSASTWTSSSERTACPAASAGSHCRLPDTEQGEHPHLALLSQPHKHDRRWHPFISKSRSFSMCMVGVTPSAVQVNIVLVAMVMGEFGVMWSTTSPYFK